ncbi:MAG: SDR family oxidoreductase [Alphaproteobacteria bacterium]|nr:MAG: SDR family oxidoreductase [Alphaproteobacteria bacterium]
MDLNGKVAFVTGGSGDIGRAIAEALAASGADVAVSYLGEADRAAAVVEAVRRAGRQGHAVQFDQRDPQSIDLCLEKVMGHFGRIDILVNNAAWNIGIPFADLEVLTPEIWDRVHETNLRGPFLLSRLFASELRRHKAGRIINIASLAGLAPVGSSIAYAASKAGLIHLTHCMAVALAPDVTVNCIAPGLVEGTRMAERLPEAMKQLARTQAVLGRSGSPDDIAQIAVAYCRADSVTGQTVVVDGGNPLGMH